MPSKISNKSLLEILDGIMPTEEKSGLNTILLRYSFRFAE